jgi:site-specific DNA-cytosine methylase
MESLRKQGVTAWSSHEFGDERNALMHQYVLYLRALRPKAFLFENVSNFLSVLKTPAGQLDAETALNEAIEELSNHKISYQITSQLVNASHQGVPQDRRRFIMVGFSSTVPKASKFRAEFFPMERVDIEVPLEVALMGLDSPHEFTPFTGGKRPTALQSRTFPPQSPLMADSWIRYLNWVMQTKESDQSRAIGTTDAHVFRTVRADDMALLKRFGPGQRWMDYLVKDSQTLAEMRRVLGELIDIATATKDQRSKVLLRDGKRLLDKSDARLALRLILEQTERSLEEQHLLHDHYLSEEKGHGDWFERLPANRPCKTIISHIGKDTYSYFHPYQNRALSIREAARVQSFPDSFSFRSTGIVEGYAMIGNAVPPLLSARLAARFAELHLRDNIFGNTANPQSG